MELDVTALVKNDTEQFLESFSGDLKLGDLKRKYKDIFESISRQIEDHKQYKHLITAVDCYFDYRESKEYLYVKGQRERWKLDLIHLLDMIWIEMLADDAYIYLDYRPIGGRKRKVFTKAVYTKAVKAFKTIMADIGQPDNTSFDYWQAVRDRLLPESFEFMGKTFHAYGRGLYPYDCKMKDKHPSAMIYKCEETGSWCTEFDRSVNALVK